MYTSISRADAREIAKQNKILKIIIVVLVIACTFAIAVAHNYKTQLRMNEYAMDNNCEWNYSYYIDEEPVCKQESDKKSQPKGWLFLLFVRSSPSLRHSREPLRHFRGSCLSVWLRLVSSPLWPQPDYRQVWQRASLALLLLTPSEIFTCLRLREYFFSCLGSRHDPIASARGLGFAPATEGGHESHS